MREGEGHRGRGREKEGRREGGKGGKRDIRECTCTV